MKKIGEKKCYTKVRLLPRNISYVLLLFNLIYIVLTLFPLGPELFSFYLMSCSFLALFSLGPVLFFTVFLHCVLPVLVTLFTISVFSAYIWACNLVLVKSSWWSWTSNAARKLTRLLMLGCTFKIGLICCVGKL